MVSVPDFRGTPEQIGRIVLETEQSASSWRSSRWPPVRRRRPTRRPSQTERIAREYDEQIKAMDEALARKRRGAFIPGEPDENVKPPRRKTGT